MTNATNRIVLDCAHTDTCLPDYWNGHHLPHVCIPVYKGMHLTDVRDMLRSELKQGAVAGSDERTRDDSGDIGDKWFKAAHAAVNRIKPATKGKRRLFGELEESDDEDFSVYAYFVFVDRDE